MNLALADLVLCPMKCYIQSKGNHYSGCNETIGIPRQIWDVEA